MQKNQIEGSEFDWFISDQNGYLALCSSAGFGDVPTRVLDHCTEDKIPIQLIDELITTLPVIGSSKNEGSGPGNCQEWIDLAARGIWIYDWQHWSGPYARIVQPSIKLNIKSLSKTVLSELRVVQLDDFDIKTATSFQVSTLGL